MIKYFVRSVIFGMLALALSMVANAETETVNGIEWEYTISGSAAVDVGPSQKSSISEKVIIPSYLGGRRVERIRSYAFEGRWELASVEIPICVTSVGSMPFYGCDRLTSAIAPALEGIFSGCRNLTEVTISEGVTRIEPFAFEGCSGLTSVKIPVSVMSIERFAFAGCSGLTSVEIPSSVTRIESSAFQGCTGLTSVTIPSSVTYVEAGVFSGCAGLTSASATVPALKSILGDCHNLSHVTIPGGVTYIESGAFAGCRELTSVTIPSSVMEIGNSAFRDCSGLTSLTIPSSVRYIGAWAFEGCSGLTSLTIPSSVTDIEYGAFRDCRGLISVTIPSSATRIASGVFEGCSGLTSAIAPALRGVFAGCQNLTHVTIPGGVASVEQGAFQDCRGLISVTIPSSVTRIEAGAFADCSGLTSVTIPSSVTSIEQGAFQGCSGLTSVTIPSSVRYIGAWAFEGCSGLTSLTIPSSVTDIEYGAFQGCSGLTSVTIPSSVTWIASEVFEGCSGLTSVTIPSSVTSIEGGAFRGCSGLTSLTIPSSVTYIALSAFEGCTRLANIVVAAENQEYSSDEGVLFNKDQTELFWFPEGKNGSYTIPPSVTSIGNDAFYGCSGLTSIDIPDGVTSIGGSAFYGCSGLTSIDIPDGVTSIGYFAFYGCSGLTSIDIPDGVTSIGGSAFYGCSGLTDITVEAENQRYSSVDGVLFNKDQTELIYFPNGKSGSYTIPSRVTSIGSTAFRGCSGLTSIDIPDGVTSIGGSAFSSCSGLTSIDIPDGVTSIGNDAFYGCSGLTSIDIPDGVTSIGSSAFSSCSGLKSVYIPDSVTSVVYRAFSGCWELKKVSLPASLESSADEFKINEDTQIYIRGVSSGVDPCVVYNASDVTKIYDGTSCSVTVKVSRPDSGYSIQYAVNATGPWSDERPTLKDVGSMTTFFKISAAGVEDVIDSRTVMITHRPVTLTSGSGSWKYDAQVHANETVAVGGAGFLPGDEPTFSRFATIREIGTKDNVFAYAFAEDCIASNYTVTVETGVLEVVAASFSEALDMATASPELVWKTGVDAPWFVQTAVVSNGLFAVQSGDIDPGAESWIETTVEGAGTLSFTWKVSCEERYDSVQLLVDGVVSARLTGEQDWQTHEVVLTGGGTHTLRWRYAKSRSGDAGSDCAWLDHVVWTRKTSVELTLKEALDVDNVTWKTTGDAVWFARTDVAYDSIDAARSGKIADFGRSRLETVVYGPGKLTYAWKVSCEEGYDWFDFLLDGDLEYSITGEADWETMTIVIPEGRHVLAWEYWKDDYDEEGMTGEDCAWLDFVKVESVAMNNFTTSTPEPVPHDWLDRYPTILDAAGGNYEQAAKARAANGVNTVGECYIAGLDPTNEESTFTSSIEIVDGAVVVSWSPNVKEEDPKSRVYTVQQLVEDEWKDVLVTQEASEMKITRPEADETGVWLYRVKVALP